MNIINRLYFNYNHYSKNQQSRIKNLSNEHASILNTKSWTFKIPKEIPKEGKNFPLQKSDFTPMF